MVRSREGSILEVKKERKHAWVERDKAQVVLEKAHEALR